MADNAFKTKNDIIVGGTQYLRVAIGNTGQRSGSPINGEIRYNTDTSSFEGYSNNSWTYLAPVSSLGADLTLAGSLTVGNSTVNVYTNSTGIFIGGTNQKANGSVWYIGNSTANTIVSTVGIQIGANVVANLTHIAIGNSTINIIANSTNFAVGANVVLTPTGAQIGNSTLFILANTSTLAIVNSTSNTYIRPGYIIVGNNVTVNGSQISLGTDVNVTTTYISVGNSTVNTYTNSTGFYLNGVAVGGGSGVSVGKIQSIS